MNTAGRLFWSVKATAQYLEAGPGARQQIDACVDLIRRFPLIGVRLTLARTGNRRRFVCAGFQIFHDLRETRLAELNRGGSAAGGEAPAAREEITIRFFKRT